MKTKIKKFWDYFNGKKRNIGIIAMWILKVVLYQYPDLLSPEAQTIVREGIDVFLIGGVFDALRRTDKSKKIINKALSKININN